MIKKLIGRLVYGKFWGGIVQDPKSESRSRKAKACYSTTWIGPQADCTNPNHDKLMASGGCPCCIRVDYR